MAFLSIPYFNSMADDVDNDPFHLLTTRRPGSSLMPNRGPSNDTIRNFSPRFDIRESKDAYHLDGELPGIEQKDVEIEFSDLHTMVVKGHTARSYEHSSADDERAPAKTGPSRKATVEEEKEESADGTVQKKPTSKPQYKYWVSERSSGSFHRTFNFPVQVDQDGVKASLRKGILSVHVPKQLTKKPTRKIQIE